jgi:hypothetical protein
MSVVVTQRPGNPNTSNGVVNGGFVGSIAPWANFGAGTVWAYDSGDVKNTIVAGNSKQLRQPFNAKSGVTYNYSFQLDISAAGAFNISMSFIRADGTSQTIANVAAVNGLDVHSGDIVASADAVEIAFLITENIP